MFSCETYIRVRYAETDQMGYMYYGNYAQYYEVGRVEMLRKLGLTYKQFEQDGFIMPVLELNCKFIKPARYDDHIKVVTLLKQLPATRILFTYELFNEQEEIINIGSTTLVFVDMSTMKPCPPPPSLVEKLGPYFNDANG